MFVSFQQVFAPVETNRTEDDDLLFEMTVPKTNLITQLKRADEGYVILKGSYVRSKIVQPASDTLKSLRQRLLSDSSLVEQDGEMLSTRNTLLNSPAAAILVNGQGTNGWDTWVSRTHGSLAQVYRTTA